MPFMQPAQTSPLELRLARDLTVSIKRGHPWVFADALRHMPAAPPGTSAILLDSKRGRPIARGFYDPTSPLAFRVCTPDPAEALNDAWAKRRLYHALSLRKHWFTPSTTGYRLLNGEGDGLPGLVCDIYNDTAVLQLDGTGPRGFWNLDAVAQWVTPALDVTTVYDKSRQTGGTVLIGAVPSDPVMFMENGLHFTADVVAGQKTGFFLDQRDHRALIGRLAHGQRCLNLFGYTGGFSVYAGHGGATHVTTVDLARPAIEAAAYHWQLNGLSPSDHHGERGDVFAFLEATSQRWDVVIADPPAFASSKKAVPKALTAYQNLVAASAAVTEAGGFLAAASCSSHVRRDDFLSACEAGISKARKRATIVGIYGQPFDHPSPLVLSEFRYLKFVLMRVD